MSHTPFLAFAAAVLSVSFGSPARALAEKPFAPPVAQKQTTNNRYLSVSDARVLADRAISSAQMKDYLSFIASDELQGRDTPSNGLNTAAKFIATYLSRWGFKPAGDNGTFFQKIPLTRNRVDAAATRGALGGTPLSYPDDFVMVPGRGRIIAANADVSASTLVYVGQGWVLPKKSIDPYKGLDIRGKILVVRQRLGQRFPGGPDFANSVSVQQYATTHGAAGIAYLSESRETFDPLRADALVPRGGFSVAAPSPAVQAPVLPSIILSPEISRQLFAGEKSDSAAAIAPEVPGAESEVPSFEFAPTKKMSLTIHYAAETVKTQNVVAVWEGGDSALKTQYVAFGAHYDHVGMSATPDKDGDTIYNGADDDGSGTTALLAMADALHQSKLRPRRSLLFVWHCGEEKGLWGSAYFTDHPTVPLDKISAQLNIDMIGRSRLPGDNKSANANLTGPKAVYIIGSQMMSNELGNLVQRVNKSYQNLTLDYTYDDPKDPNRFFYRSDHINYARKGVPIIFWFDGVHEDYHRRSDEVSKIDFAKMTSVTRTVFLTGVTIANLPNKLVVDKKLSLPGRN